MPAKCQIDRLRCSVWQVPKMGTYQTGQTVVLQSSQPGTLPQVPKLGTCGGMTLKIKFPIWGLEKKKRIDIHQSAFNIIMLFSVLPPVIPVRALSPARLSSVPPAV